MADKKKPAVLTDPILKCEIVPTTARLAVWGAGKDRLPETELEQSNTQITIVVDVHAAFARNTRFCLKDALPIRFEFPVHQIGINANAPRDLIARKIAEAFGVDLDPKIANFMDKAELESETERKQRLAAKAAAMSRKSGR